MPRTYKIVVIPGGGIGREVKPETVKALKACEEAVPGLNFEFIEFEAGAMYYLKPEGGISSRTSANLSRGPRHNRSHYTYLAR